MLSSCIFTENKVFIKFISRPICDYPDGQHVAEYIDDVKIWKRFPPNCPYKLPMDFPHKELAMRNFHVFLVVSGIGSWKIELPSISDTITLRWRRFNDKSQNNHIYHFN